ncbi:hypothetical protein D9613_006571 [Agrocybe pediades]|uniref:Uncharacterized protein n=1 Tax=Agrocybe pediades TaxID=84607 RepID=A0A8H4QI10_9AGAR|nr:hypothetical protein D9613_006571 [Agrocybe pediades]
MSNGSGSRRSSARTSPRSIRVDESMEIEEAMRSEKFADIRRWAEESSLFIPPEDDQDIASASEPTERAYIPFIPPQYSPEIVNAPEPREGASSPFIPPLIEHTPDIATPSITISHLKPARKNSSIVTDTSSRRNFAEGTYHLMHSSHSVSHLPLARRSSLRNSERSNSTMAAEHGVPLPNVRAEARSDNISSRKYTMHRNPSTSQWSTATAVTLPKQHFVANDPFHRRTSFTISKDVQNFDEIPLPEEVDVDTPEVVQQALSNSSNIPRARRMSQLSYRSSSTMVESARPSSSPEEIRLANGLDEQDYSSVPSNLKNENVGSANHLPYGSRTGDDTAHSSRPGPQYLPLARNVLSLLVSAFSRSDRREEAQQPVYPTNGISSSDLPYQRRPRLNHRRTVFSASSSETGDEPASKMAVRFLVATLPSQIYLYFLFRLPSLYFSRVARIFEEAEMTLPELKKMAIHTATYVQSRADLITIDLDETPPQYERLKSTWGSFIDSLLREWETFNIISALLLSAILTILQIEGAANDPVTRYTALISMICALMSLLYGCMYIVRFGNMRKTYKAAEWALEAQRTNSVIWWNVWVLLAMPSIWLTWAIISYIACIMSFIWLTTPQGDVPAIALSPTAIFAVRVCITGVLGLGVLYGALILDTFSRYGDVMDRTWKERIEGWVAEKMEKQSTTSKGRNAYSSRTSVDAMSPYHRIPSTESLRTIRTNDSRPDSINLNNALGIELDGLLYPYSNNVDGQTGTASPAPSLLESNTLRNSLPFKPDSPTGVRWGMSTPATRSEDIALFPEAADPRGWRPHEPIPFRPPRIRNTVRFLPQVQIINSSTSGNLSNLSSEGPETPPHASSSSLSLSPGNHEPPVFHEPPETHEDIPRVGFLPRDGEFIALSELGGLPALRVLDSEDFGSLRPENYQLESTSVAYQNPQSIVPHEDGIRVVSEYDQFDDPSTRVS